VDLIPISKEAFTACGSTYIQFPQHHNCSWWYSLLPYGVPSSSWHSSCFYDNLAGHFGFDRFVIPYCFLTMKSSWCSHWGKTYRTQVPCIWFSINWLAESSPGNILLLQVSSGKNLDALREQLIVVLVNTHTSFFSEIKIFTN
jgi:phosphoheptose isomerase